MDFGCQGITWRRRGGHHPPPSPIVPRDQAQLSNQPCPTLQHQSCVCVYVCVCLVRAEVVKLPAVKRTVEGRTLISTCAVVGEPEPTIEWRRTDRLHRHALGVQRVSDQHTHTDTCCNYVPGAYTLGRWGLNTMKVCKRGQSMFWPPKMSHSFIQNCCWITLQVSHHQG